MVTKAFSVTADRHESMMRRRAIEHRSLDDAAATVTPGPGAGAGD
jgi:hypothetical protein